MWGRSVYGERASFVLHYKLGRSQYNLTPAGAARFAIRVEEGEASESFAEACNWPKASHRMKKAEGLECSPLPCRGSRKSVNWAPQFNQPESGKKPTIKRSSTRLSSRKSASSNLDPDCELLNNSSKDKIGFTEDPSDEEVRIRIVTYPGRRGKRQRETLPADLKDPKKEQKSHSKARTLPASLKDSKKEQKSQSKARPGLHLKLRSRGRESVEDDSGKEERRDGDHGAGKEMSELWVSVPLNDMEREENPRPRYRRECQKANQSCVRFSSKKTLKSEIDHKVAISKINQVCAKLLKKNHTAATDDKTLEALQEMATSLNGVIHDVEHMIQNLQERKVQRIHAEKAECEATAAAEQQKLRDEITKLKRNHQIVQSEKLRIQGEREKLKKDYLGMLDSARDALRLQVDRDNAEASAATLTQELAKEQDKSYCQICFTVPRDAIVLPCMHFQYCSECLQKHQRRNTECPTCRSKINGVLRCNLSTS